MHNKGKAVKADEKALVQKWIETWKQTAPELEELRREEIRTADTRKAIESLDGAFKSAVRHLPPLPDSGLIEQQRLFRRIKS